jgi:hypothetical protein
MSRFVTGSGALPQLHDRLEAGEEFSVSGAHQLRKLERAANIDGIGGGRPWGAGPAIGDDSEGVIGGATRGRTGTAGGIMAAKLAGLASAGGRSVGRGDGAVCVASTASICLVIEPVISSRLCSTAAKRDLSDSLSVVTPRTARASWLRLRRQTGALAWG